ncbi:MAG TPA: TIM barrel protein [Terracidiphilus sp.]|nr:TIM barrel protein [Terracidiphilus sp.]
MGLASRRSFLKATGAIAAAACVDAHPLAARTLHLPVGLELYSVRNLLPKDYDGTLHQVRAAGYTVVEAAGYFDHTAPEVRKSMDAAGLRCVSAHYTLALLESQLDSIIDFAKTLGLEYIVCSSSGGMHRDASVHGEPTLDDWHWIAGEFNRIGEKVKAAGMTFGVHNHTPEFATIDGVLVYDELLKQCDPKVVVFEMDCGWVWASGHNPVDYLSKTPERFPLLHIKDMVRQADGKIHMPVLGKGNIDYAPILRAATKTKYYFVEQEQFDIDPIEELKQDAEYMKNLKI